MQLKYFIDKGIYKEVLRTEKNIKALLNKMEATK